MEYFRGLGERILEKWSALDFATNSFTEIALESTAEAPPSAHVTADDIVWWALKARVLPPQFDPQAKFAQPPVTVFSCDRFIIDALFWIDGTTAIHDHAFSGAFHVLSGSSLHSTFSFDVERQYSPRLSVGSLTLKRVEQLNAGGTYPIRPGAGFIHSLFHLDRPSVSIVVRTKQDSQAAPQLEYLRAGVAFVSLQRDPFVERKTQLLKMIATTAPSRLAESVRYAVATIGLTRAFATLHDLSGDLDDDLFETVLTAAQPVLNEDLLHRLRRDRAVRFREQAVVRRRQRIHSGDHRFLLALLLNVESRTKILEMVTLRRPGVAPVETVREWLKEMATVASADGRNALDLALGDAAFEVLGPLLEGLSDRDVAASLDARELIEQGDGPAEVERLCAALRNSPVLGYLFA